jgi:hypothetical protein
MSPSGNKFCYGTTRITKVGITDIYVILNQPVWPLRQDASVPFERNPMVNLSGKESFRKKGKL